MFLVEYNGAMPETASRRYHTSKITAAFVGAAIAVSGCSIDYLPRDRAPEQSSITTPSFTPLPLPTFATASALPNPTITAPGTSESVAPDSPTIDYTQENIFITTTQVEIIIGTLAVKGRAPKTGYNSDSFGGGWTTTNGCTTRQRILKRDLMQKVIDPEKCKVLSGILLDPYTNKIIPFKAGTDTDDDIQLDHVVSKSNAWQTGAQQIDQKQRAKFVNDPLNLLATEGTVNREKGESDIATWQPPYKPALCSFAARQALVKLKYDLWLTPPEKATMLKILQDCPDQTLVLKNQ